MSHSTPPAEKGDDPTRQFVELLAANERRLAAYVLALVPNWTDADDICQQTKLRLWEQFDEYDPQQDFGAWACTIAHYQAMAHRKTAKRRHARLSQQFVEAMAAEVSSLSDRVDDRHLALEKCLGLLSDTSRHLIGLVYGGDSAIKDVAQSLGRSVGATQKTVFRIRKRIQECVEEQLQMKLD